MFAPLSAGIGVARGPTVGGHVPPQLFRTYSYLCFERRYRKQNSVIGLKSNILATQIFGLVTLLPPGASCQTCERIILLLVFIV